jgi:hypothetical protein
MLVVAGLTVFALLVLAVPKVEALCGDCVVILLEPECASPPPNFALCRIYYEREFYYVGGTIVVLWFQRCEGIVECAV